MPGLMYVFIPKLAGNLCLFRVDKSPRHTTKPDIHLENWSERLNHHSDGYGEISTFHGKESSPVRSTSTVMLSKFLVTISINWFAQLIHNFDFSLRREYIPLSLLELQRMIDLGYLDSGKLIDICALCSTNLIKVKPEIRQFGIHLTDEVCFYIHK